MNHRNTTTLNIRASKELISWVDKVVEKGVYKNRSEAVRSFLREMINQK